MLNKKDCMINKRIISLYYGYIDIFDHADVQIPNMKDARTYTDTHYIYA